MKVMDGGSWGLFDWQAAKAPALRKTIALRIRQTRHVAETVSRRLAAAISECFAGIKQNVILLKVRGSAFLSWKTRIPGDCNVILDGSSIPCEKESNRRRTAIVTAVAELSLTESPAYSAPR